MEGRRSEPRSGLRGAWDRLVGPGATTLENTGTVGTAALGAVVGLTGRPSARTWGPVRRGVAALMGADLFGGVWTNATPTATWWYHGRGQGVREMLAFSALHLHPFIVAALYRDREWPFAVGNYAYLLAATAAVAGTPPPLRRGCALVLCCCGSWLNTTVWRPTPGLEWFVPVYLIKLLVSHAAGSPSTNTSR